MRIVRRTYKNYAGAVAIGPRPVSPPSDPPKNHMQRAFWLTAQLEAPRWGTVQSYDGTGMSGGPMHWVAVLPRSMEQGPLWGLIHRLEITPTSVHKKELEDLWEELEHRGWYVSRDGDLRNYETGNLIDGHSIVETFTPPGGAPGQVGSRKSKSWQTCEKWARLFSSLLSAEWSIKPQIEHSIEYLLEGAARVEADAYTFLGAGDPEHVTNELSPAEDLALCVYHSFSPNAPAVARTVLRRVLEKNPSREDFPRNLIHALGTCSYGNWEDRPRLSGSRYDRTRKFARQMGWWPKAFFIRGSKHSLMPLDL